VDFVVDGDALLDRGLDHHRSGNFAEASKCYQSFLRENPGHPHALYLSGCLEYQIGDNGAAAELLRQAIAAAPHIGDYHNALGCALAGVGKFEDAEQSLERAIALDKRADFHCSLGNLRKSQNRLPESIAAYQEALRMDASLADAHYNLGNVFRSNGNGEEAAQSFRRALELNAGHFHALAALGQMMHAAGHHAEAAGHFKTALTLQPQDTDVLCELGDVWQESGDLGQALALYQQAIKVNPRLARAWYSGGCVEIARREYVPAAMCFEKAVELQPDWLEARHNLGRALYELGQVSAALNHFRWCAAQPREASAQAHAMIAVIIPGAPEADNQAVLDARRSWAERDLAGRTTEAEAVAKTARGQPLRIGYVSSFFHRDNWMKPVWGLMNQHDRGLVEVHLFSDAPATSIQHGYRPHPQDRFFDTTKLSNEALAGLVHQAGIDILVDLNGYSNMRRLPLFSLLPFPIAIGWFNF
jgi:protein O-GlcNAc transferase